MNHRLRVSCAFILVGVSGAAHAQTSQQPQHLVGSQISGNMRIDAATRLVVDTATVRFAGGDGGPAYTIDFVTQHLVDEPVSASAVVDMIVTQHQGQDDSPMMTLHVDGGSVPVVPRLHSRRSVVASMPFAEFDRMVRGVVVVDRTFAAELELGPGQLQMLRAIADRWAGRVR